MSMAMDKHHPQKKMASVLIYALYNDSIEPEKLAKGYMKLLMSEYHLKLDVPYVTDILALFLNSCTGVEKQLYFGTCQVDVC